MWTKAYQESQVKNSCWSEQKCWALCTFVSQFQAPTCNFRLSNNEETIGRWTQYLSFIDNLVFFYKSGSEKGAERRLNLQQIYENTEQSECWDRAGGRYLSKRAMQGFWDNKRCRNLVPTPPQDRNTTESVVFLQWFYETNNSKTAFRASIYLFEWITCTSEQDKRRSFAVSRNKGALWGKDFTHRFFCVRFERGRTLIVT